MTENRQAGPTGANCAKRNLETATGPFQQLFDGSVIPYQATVEITLNIFKSKGLLRCPMEGYKDCERSKE